MFLCGCNKYIVSLVVTLDERQAYSDGLTGGRQPVSIIKSYRGQLQVNSAPTRFIHQ